MKLIIAIFTLHNFLIDEEDLEDEEVEGIEVDIREIDMEIDEGNEIDDERDFSTRDILLRHTQWLMH